MTLPPGSLLRKAVLCLGYVSLSLLVSQPNVIFFSRLGWSAWYPATGLILALLLSISPRYVWLVCVADALPGLIFYHASIWSFGETLGSIGVAACYGTAAYLLRGRFAIDIRLRRGRDVVRYVAVAMGAALCATASGVLCLIGDHSIAPSEFWTSAADWFIGDSIGLVALTPFLLIHIAPALRRWLGFENETSDTVADRDLGNSGGSEWLVLESAGQAASLLAVLWIMFGPHWARLEPLYLSFVPILWLAMRGATRSVVIGSLALTFGIVVSVHVFPPGPNVVAKIGLLMLVVSASGLAVGATVAERQRLGVELHERTTYLDSLFENSPFGIVVLNHLGRVHLINDAFAKLSFYGAADLIGHDLDSVFQGQKDAQDEASPWSAAVLAGHTVQRILRRNRKDGAAVDVELHAFPLVIGSRVQGAYAVCKDISAQMRASLAEREHAESLNRAVKKLELQTNQMSMLHEMAALLECCGTTKEACSVVGQSAPKLFPEAVSGALYTFKASRNLVEAAAAWGNAVAVEPVFEPHACWALRRGQPHRSKSGGVVCPHLEDLPPSEHLCLPMVGQGETLGVLHLEFPSGAESEEQLSARQRLGVTVAGQMALSLASLRLRETLRDQSIRDPLTGLFNRRFMQESLEREFLRARRKNHPLSVLCLDIDHFKRFNDTFGHDAGDFVLQSVADLLRGFFRGDDVACRCGGEEFAVILPESLARHAALRANQFREDLKQLKLVYKDTRLGPISVSIGVATFPEHCATTNDLFETADRCLYQSKSSGRDRVTVAVPQAKEAAK